MDGRRLSVVGITTPYRLLPSTSKRVPSYATHAIVKEISSSWLWRRRNLTIVVPPDSLKKSLEDAATHYHNQLPGSLGEEYLLKVRGLTKSVVDSFRLGFVETPLTGDDMFKGMISIPFLTKTGPVAIQYRAVADKEPRFLTKGSTKRLFNPSVLLSPHRTVYICEGPVDTLTVSCLGLPAVGVPGVGQWSPVFARAFRNRKVVVLADGDDTGQGEDLARRILGDVEECDIIIFQGEDVNSFWLKYGEKELRSKLGAI